MPMFLLPTAKPRTSGFILIEMIVSTGLFSMAVVILVGALIVLTDGSRKARAQRTAIDNLSAAIEGMSRAIRVGSTYHCGAAPYDVVQDCPIQSASASDKDCFIGGTVNGPFSTFAFEPTGGDPSSAGDQWVYRRTVSGGHGFIERSKDNGTNWAPITAPWPEMDVKVLSFYVTGTQADTCQPRVTMVIDGEAGGNNVKARTNFTVQTTIAQRMPNYDLTP